MKVMLLLAALACGLSAQSYTCVRIANDYAGKDVSATGVRLLNNPSVPWGGDLDEGHADDYPIGFTFQFYGQSHATVDICTNGWVSFNPIQGTLPYMPASPPATFPSTSYPNGFVAAGWQDLWGYVMSQSSGMFAQTVGTAPNREFRVQFNNMTKRQPPGGTMSFLWVFREADNSIEIHYGHITDGTVFACGLESPSGNEGTASADGWLLGTPVQTAYRFEPQPEIEVERAAQAVPHQGTDNIGTVTAGTATAVTYRVRNTGVGALTLTGVNLSGMVNCSVSAGGLPGTVPPGSYADLDLQVTAAATGFCSFLVSIGNNDLDESPFAFSVDANAVPTPAAEIELTYQSLPRQTGEVVTLGAFAVGRAQVISVRVHNPGTADLHLTGAPVVRLAAVQNCAVTVTKPPAVLVAPGAHTDCELEFTPTAFGPFGFEIALDSNDSDETPYVLHFAGSAGAENIGGSHKGGGGCVLDTTRGAGLLPPFLLLAAALRRGKRRRRDAIMPRPRG
jgi:hypothetical protein